MRNVVFTFLFSLLIFGCKKDDQKEFSNYDKGLIILNEGQFGAGSGTISFLEPSKNTAIDDVFGIENGGAKIGNILQSLTIVGDRYYFVVNNSNKVVITNKVFKYQTEITGFELPRYIDYKGDKAYVTQWGKDGITGSLAIVDLITNQIQKTIPLGKGPENMLVQGDKIYVSMSGGFGSDNRIMVVDLFSETVTKTIVVDDCPGQLVQKGDEIVALCKGYNDYLMPSNSTFGSVVILKDNVIKSKITLPDFADNLIKKTSSDTLFFTVGGQPAKWDAISPDYQKYSYSGYIYRLSNDLATDQLIVSDAGDFTSRGKIHKVGADFNIISSIDAGIIPSHVYSTK